MFMTISMMNSDYKLHTSIFKQKFMKIRSTINKSKFIGEY